MQLGPKGKGRGAVRLSTQRNGGYRRRRRRLHRIGFARRWPCSPTSRSFSSASSPTCCSFFSTEWLYILVL
jgi:hypothetical protein